MVIVHLDNMVMANGVVVVVVGGVGVGCHGDGVDQYSVFSDVPSSAMIKLPTSLGCLLGTQPAVVGAGSLVELKIRIYWVEEGYKMQNKAWFSHRGASYPLYGAPFITSHVCRCKLG